uniref:CUB domain-containing protein n=1 Tax=Meloidogyne hapla TaxID=6305 RepID=A0A1I8B2A1_MELHA
MRQRNPFCYRNYLKIDPNEIKQIVYINNGKTMKSNDSTKIPENLCLRIAEPMEIISKQNKLTLEFNSNNEPENHFWLSWNTLGKEKIIMELKGNLYFKGCGGIITQNGSRLIANASEGADFDGEDPYRKCIWYIKAPIGYSIQVFIERMQTEPVPAGQKCFEVQPAGFNGGEKTRLRDGVQFYAVDSQFAFEKLSGGNEEDLPLKAFCGQLKNVSFTWGGNSAASGGLAIVFSYHTDTTQLLTDTLVGAAIFGDGTFAPVDDQIVFSAKINFLPISTEGNGIIFVDPHSDSFIQSPNYPKPYPRSIELTWKFETSEGFRPAFQILNFTSPVLGTSIFDRRGGTGMLTSQSPNNSLNPDDYSCGYHMLYLRGGLIFSEGNVDSISSSQQTNHENLFYGSISQTRYRICKDIRVNPVEIIMDGVSNSSIVTFRGAPYDQIGSDTTNSDQQQPKTQRPIGFRLRVYAKCGGILWVSSERKVLNTANVGLKMQQNNNKINENNTINNTNICEWNLRLSESVEGDQKIFVRIEQLFFPTTSLESSNYEEPPQLEFFCGEDSKGIVEASKRYYIHLNSKTYTLTSSTTPQQQHFHEFVCDQNKQARLVGKHLDILKSSAFLISYDVASTFCGGQLNNDYQGRLALNPISSPTECEWTINAVKGSHVDVQILTFSLPISEFCTNSFLEFRETNSSGSLIGRFCGDLFPPSVENVDGPIYIRLRHKMEQDWNNEDNEGDDDNIREHTVYGQTSSHIIESQTEGLIDTVSWRIATEDSENWIQFGLAEYVLAPFPARLNVHPSWCFLVPSTSEEACVANDPLAISFSALSPPERNYLYTLRSNKATIVFYQNFYSRFKLYWKEIDPRKGEHNGTSQIDNIEKSKDDGFTCGGELIATYKVQTLASPIDQSTMNYPNNERCKWTIRRPQFANILLSVTNLDLEPHPFCQYDWLSLGTVNYEKATELDNIPTIQRICQKQQQKLSSTSLTQQTSTSVEINSADLAFIYFYTDRSRTSVGFSLNYSLSCNSIELLLPSQGILDTQLSLQPSTEDISNKNLRCHWSILVLSRRDIFVQALEMDLAPREWSSQECLNDALEFSSTPFYSEETVANRSLVHCGQEKFNLTVPSGYLFIRYRRALPKGRGFKLHLNEIVHDCASSIIQLDELSPLKIINSPDFPLPSPNSLDCNWILSAPPGRRLQFTIDPKTFLLQNPISGERCEEDYLEIRDGSSHASTLVGRFCETNAPSTFISTGEHLYIRYVTDSDSESPGWNATVSLSSCGGSVVLVTGQNSTIHSLNFPDIYPPSLRCEWTIFAPRGHFVEAMMEHFWLSATENCSFEYLTIRDYNSTGEFIQRPTCSKTTLTSNGIYRSQHRSLSILFVVNYTTTTSSGRSSYISANTAARAARLFCLARKCGFSLKLWSSKLSCGGTIKDDGGVLSLPYGSSSLAEIPLFCQWNFQAGIGYRYLLDFEFLSNNGNDEYALMNNADKTSCFLDLLFYDGIDFGDRILSSNSQYFCSNKTRIITTTDISILKYDNNNCGENYLKGFCNYAKIINLSPKIDWKLLNKKQFKIKYTKVPKDLNNASSFCHIQIRKLNPDFITLHLQILNVSFYSSGYSNDKLSNKCTNWESQFLIKDENYDPIDFKETICRNNFLAQNNHTNIILLNSQLDIYAFKLSANIILDFHGLN